MQPEGAFQEGLPKVEEIWFGAFRSINMADTNDSYYYNERDVLSGSCSQLVDAWILVYGFLSIWFLKRSASPHTSQLIFGNVYMGNDKARAVVGMGQVQIARDDGGVWTLCDVWLILSWGIIWSHLVPCRPIDIAPCGAYRPWIFFINGVLCFLKINGSGMEKEERSFETPLQGEDESTASSPP